MHKNWKTYKLGDIALLGDGAHSKVKRIENGVLYLTSKNFKEGKLKLDKIDYMSEKDFERLFSSESKAINKPSTGDVLLGIIGTLGNAYLFKNEDRFGISSSVAIIRSDKNILHPRYLYYYITSKVFKHFQNAHNGASVQGYTNLPSLRSIPISLPKNLHEQRAIASILSALDDKIENNLALNKTMKNMAMALYKHWFVDFGPFQEGKFIDSELGEIPEGWEVKRLDSLIKFSNGYAFKSKQLLKEEVEDCYHIFKMGHIEKGGGLKPNGTKSWIKKSDCYKLEKYVLKTGDILMSMTDMKDNMTILGHTALMNENEKYIVNQRVGLLRINNSINVGFPFIYMLTNSYDYIDRLRSQANSGVQVNLSTDAIKSSKVITPSSDINLTFHKACLPLFENINENAKENQTLTQLRDNLLPKLISGEIRLKEFEEEITAAL